VNRRAILARRPVGRIDETTIRIDDAPVPALEPGQALVKVRYLSIDATIRLWMNEDPSYVPPIKVGSVVRGLGLGEVVESTTDEYPVGCLVSGMTGWQEYCLADTGRRRMAIVKGDTSPTQALNVLGVNGLAAYFGLRDVGDIREGDQVVVSAAAGATGSIVGQLARIWGAGRVVGIAGTEEKCRWLTEELGFDDAINYRSGPIGDALALKCPGDIDLYWDNVGGEVLDACLEHLAGRGRVVLCGAVSSYNHASDDRGLRNHLSLLMRRGRMEGFIVFDFEPRYAEAQAQLEDWLRQGRIKTREFIVSGLDNAAAALNLLLDGRNMGKTLVELDGSR